MFGVIALFRVFQQNPGFEFGSVFFAYPGEFEFLFFLPTMPMC